MIATCPECAAEIELDEMSWRARSSTAPTAASSWRS